MSSFLITLQGEPEGGTVNVDVLLAQRVVSLAVEVAAGSELRLASEELSSQIADRVDPTECQTDHSGGLVLIRGARDVIATSEDDGLFVTEVEVDAGVGISGLTRGGRDVADAGLQGLLESDRRVVAGLSGVVGQLARQSEVEADLMGVVAKAQSVAASHLGGAAPGGDSGTAASLMESNATMTRAAAELAKARAEQLEAIALKEEEAKGNTPSGGQTPDPVTTPGGVVTPPPPTPSGGGGGGGGSQPPGGAPTEAQSPAGTGDPTKSVVKPACRIIEYIIDGQVFVIGEIDGLWYLSQGKGTVVVGPDGDERWNPNAYDFGRDGDGSVGSPDLQQQLEDLYQKRQAKAAAGEEDTWSTLRGIGGFLVDLAPIVGDIKGAVDALAGFDIVTGDALSPGERAFAAGTALVGLMTLGLGSSVMRAGGKTAARIQRVVDAGRSGQKIAKAEQDFVAATLRRMRRRALETRTRNPRDLRKACEIVDSLDPATAGRRLARNSCFVAGTEVRLPDGNTAPIETLAGGWAVLAAPEDLRAEGGPAVRQVLQVSKTVVQEVCVVTLAAGSRSVTLRVTPEHGFATDVGFCPAAELSAGDELVALAAEPVTVTAVTIEEVEGVEVYNLQVDADPTYFVSTLGVLVHNGKPCPTWKNMDSAQQAAHLARLKAAKRALLGHEGRAGSFAELNAAAKKAQREYASDYKLRFGRDRMVPSSQVITPNHIPMASVLTLLRIPGLNRQTGGAINMTMRRHLDMHTTASKINHTRQVAGATKPVGAMARRNHYAQMLTDGKSKSHVLQQALRDDIVDMQRVARDAAQRGTTGMYDDSVAALVNYYRTNFPGYMRGFRL